MIGDLDLMRRPEIGTAKHHPRWMEAMAPAGKLVGKFAKSHGRRVSEVMSTHVISASEDTPLGDIANLLEKHRIKCVRSCGTASWSGWSAAPISSRRSPLRTTGRTTRLYPT